MRLQHIFILVIGLVLLGLFFTAVLSQLTPPPLQDLDCVLAGLVVVWGCGTALVTLAVGQVLRAYIGTRAPQTEQPA